MVDVDVNAEIGAALTKEIKKSEESLHNRLGRLISKELDKQRECSAGSHIRTRSD